jgi:hypothetical protein
MIDITIPETSEMLFETTLEPEKQDLGSIKGEDISEGVIQLFLSKRNKVAIGLPYYENITPIIKRERKWELSQEMRENIEAYDFHFVSLNCSFLPDSACRFTWARFEVELFTFPISEQPIAWDICPSEITTEVKQTQGITISPELCFKLDKTETSAKLFTVNTQKEFFLYEPQIFSFGFRRTNVSWDFRSTMEKGIWGDKRNLLLIVMVPQNSQLKGRFKVSAQVEIQRTPLRLSFSKREDSIVNKMYNLSR